MEKKNLIVLGDVNICSNKWNDSGCKLKEIAEEIKSTLAQCGMEHIDLGFTYLADRTSVDGKPIESALDHIYRSVNLEDNTYCNKLEDASTDHLPVKISIKVTIIVIFENHSIDYFFDDIQISR